MGIFDIFKKKKAESADDVELKEFRAAQNREKTELARARLQLDMQRAKLDSERQKIEMEIQIERARQELADLRGDDDDDEYEDDGDNPESMLMQVLGKVMEAKAAPAPVASAPTQSNKDKLISFWNAATAEQKNFIKKMQDEHIRDMIVQKMPDMDAQSISEGIAYVRAN